MAPLHLCCAQTARCSRLPLPSVAPAALRSRRASRPCCAKPSTPTPAGQGRTAATKKTTRIHLWRPSEDGEDEEDEEGDEHGEDDESADGEMADSNELAAGLAAAAADADAKKAASTNQAANKKPRAASAPAAPDAAAAAAAAFSSRPRCRQEGSGRRCCCSLSAVLVDICVVFDFIAIHRIVNYGDNFA